MKSIMVLWLYSAEQYRNNTPINEIAEHAALNGFNDEEVEVLCLHGYEFIPEADRARLREKKFVVRDGSAAYRSIAARFPNLRQLYPNHFFECFLRWIVLREVYGTEPLLAWDADIFFNEKLSRIHAEFAGSTCTSSSTCFVALHDPRWLQVYEEQLDLFEADPRAYLMRIFEALQRRKKKSPAEFDGCFFGRLAATALGSRASWEKLFASTPEEMLVDYLVREKLLPHHLAKGSIDYLVCPQPLLLPELAWVHPMGSGLKANAGAEAGAEGFRRRDGRYHFNGQPLAFVHFQGALFRASALHLIYSRFLGEATMLHDEFYCPPEQRKGRAVVQFFTQRKALGERIAALPAAAELRQRWGDPFSERDVARAFFIQSDLSEVFAHYCMNPNLTRSVAKPGAPALQLSPFAVEMQRFFKDASLACIEREESGAITVSRCSPGGNFTAPEILADKMPAQFSLPGGCADVIINSGSIDAVAAAELPAFLTELYRLTTRTLALSVPATAARSRAWWEGRCFAAGFRKHAFYQLVTSYEMLEHDGARLTLLLEKIPESGLLKYPLAALEAERDLHNDMTRVSGRRSDAHIARYVLARRYLPKAGLVIDGACGLGYGSAVLANANPAVQVVGLDCSDFAVTYATETFGPAYPNVCFQVGDVCDLSAFEDGSVGLVVSFETVEHLREPEKFLQEVRRVLRPDGNFVCSVPNRWVDEHGKDPNPWHFHVFDFSKIVALCGDFLSVRDVFNQTAGGGMKLPTAPRRIKRVNLPMTQGNDEAEWWLVAASREKLELPPVQFEAPAETIMVLTHDPKHPLYTSWLEDSPFPVVYQTAAALDFEFPPNVGLVIAADCYHEPRASMLCKAMERGIPTLLLADGILEYRNTFEHPQLAAGAVFQPVLAHKVACLGRSQARILESWGNAAQCEVAGSARFDRYATMKRRERKPAEPFRVLVMTAITPYFTEEQHVAVRQSLLDVKEFFAKTTRIRDIPLQVEWRVTKGLEQEVGVSSAVSDLTGRELAAVLQQVDAVITTPSTSMLEAMMLGLPVAVLDYCNCPHYVQPAWRITARDHLVPVVTELTSPPAAKLLFQETTLHDALECTSPAASRQLRLATEMIAIGQKSRATGEALKFPPRILGIDGQSPAEAENRFELAALYPDNSQFRERDLQLLQVEVGRLRAFTGQHSGVNAGEVEKINARAKLTVQWRSKFEAAVELLNLKQGKPALDLLMQSLKVIEKCQMPDVSLAALLDISEAMSRLDVARARVLLEIAAKLAQQLKKPEAAQRAASALSKLAAASPKKAA